MSVLGPLLEQRADQVRALGLLLEVRCPDPRHAHAVAGVPCYEPSEERPWGWVCLPRMEREIDTRVDRWADEERRRRRDNARHSRDGFERRRAAKEARRVAQIVDRIAAAARAARMKEEA